MAERKNIKNKSNKSIMIITMIIIIVIISAGGYWFGYRPYQIRKFCNDAAIKNAKEIKGSCSGSTSKDILGKGYYESMLCSEGITWQSSYDTIYNACLRKRGLDTK